MKTSISPASAPRRPSPSPHGETRPQPDGSPQATTDDTRKIGIVLLHTPSGLPRISDPHIATMVGTAKAVSACSANDPREVMGGIETLARIHAISDVPVIMLTESGSEPDRIRVLMDGADDCMSKPINLHTWISRLRRKLGDDLPLTTIPGVGYHLAAPDDMQEPTAIARASASL